MARTVVAMFASSAEAEQAAEMLVDEGFERRAIDIQAGEGTRPAGLRREREEESWWEWLFGSSEESTIYSEGLRGGSAILSATVPDDRAEYARALLEGQGADVQTRGAGTAARTGTGPEVTEGAGRPAAGARRGDEEEVLPVVEEKLKIGKRPLARHVRIYTRVVEQPVEEDVRLRQERVRVERRPVDRAVTAADTAFREGEIEMTETAEEAVVGKEARVVEEVVASKDVEEEIETVRDTVRRTEVDVEPARAAGTAAAGRSGGSSYRANEPEFRRHWQTIGQGRPYEECANAYDFGCELGERQGGQPGDWTSVEPEARRQWEERQPGTWNEAREPVRFAWDRSRPDARRAA